MHVFCDFDGTISVKDTTDEILSLFALPEWEAIEDEWKRGEIGSAECMQRQIALIRASQPALDAALDSLKIDSGFSLFNEFCKANDIPLTIISDGVDYFIQRILAHNHLVGIPVIANALKIADGAYSLSCPYKNAECGFGYGVCKCKQISASRGLKIFVGDGRSDFCAVHKADMVFAKGKLAAYCREQNIAYSDYNNFSEIQQMVQARIPLLVKQTALPDLINFNTGEYHGDYA